MKRKCTICCSMPLVLVVCILMMGLSHSRLTVLAKESSSISQSVATKRWVSDWQAGIAKEDRLYQYAVRLFKAPIKRTGELTETFEGNNFGRASFFFAGGSELRIETYPPETMVARLTVPKGFPNERKALAVLKQYAADIGMAIEWAKPAEERKGSVRTVSYGSVDPGYNAIAVMVYKKGKLVEIRYSMAL